MPSAATKMRGLDLNCRFGVIGSQNGSMASRVRGLLEEAKAFAGMGPRACCSVGGGIGPAVPQFRSAFEMPAQQRGRGLVLAGFELIENGEVFAAVHKHAL